MDLVSENLFTSICTRGFERGQSWYSNKMPAMYTWHGPWGLLSCWPHTISVPVGSVSMMLRGARLPQHCSALASTKVSFVCSIEIGTATRGELQAAFSSSTRHACLDAAFLICLSRLAVLRCDAACVDTICTFGWCKLPRSTGLQAALCLVFSRLHSLTCARRCQGANRR